jgi:sugar lactone lactonase YvrE
LAIDLNGNLLIADTGNKRILHYTTTGEFIRQIGGGGVVAGRFEEPTAVTVDPTDGTVLVADAWNGRIQRFTPTLEVLAEFAVPGWAGRDVFQKPYLAVSAQGTLYATDPATALVMVLDRNGAVQAAFGGPGSDPNNLSQPNGIVFDPVGDLLLVADGGSSRILAFPEVDW